jgi:class 3 adenylate cyclase/DNA-binding NarL/FixJ family response regulator
MSQVPGSIAQELTFLFTDIEGSTQLLQRLGPRYAEVLEQHRRLIAAAIAAHGGQVVDRRGDEFFAAFVEPAEATAAAVAAQRALLGASWPDDGEVLVRMGVHRGRAQAAGEGYVGLAVHHAARVCQTARGGEILVSDAVPVADLELLDLGEQALKGIPQPTRLFRVVASGLRTGFPPLPASNVRRETQLRVALADDSVLLREGIAALLEEAGFDVVGQAGTAEDLLALIDEALPDVAIVDIRMPPTKTDEGLRAAREIRRRHPRIGVLILSSYIDVPTAVEVFESDVTGMGYLLKERVADVDDFTAAVRRVAAGGTAIDPVILERVRAGGLTVAESTVLEDAARTHEG